MTTPRLLFLGILALGLAMVATFHAEGPLGFTDARVAAHLEGGRLSVRALDVGVEVVRLFWAPAQIFRAIHWAAGAFFVLAAALAVLAAARAGLAAGLAVGICALFGADLGTLGLQAHPLPVLLALLAAATAAWTAHQPRFLLGGLCLGAALADQPLTLFLLPGFGLMAQGAALRSGDDRPGRALGRSVLGVLVGLAVLALPAFEAPTAAFWTLRGPGSWGVGLGEWLLALWRNSGPLGLLLGLAGPLCFFAGKGRRFRPFLLIHGVLALALVIGEFRDVRLAQALAGWTFLFWMIPTFEFLHERLDGAAAPRRAPLVAGLAGALLLAWHWNELDRSAERDLAWVWTSYGALPEDSVLCTRNPVHRALAVDGVRPDITIIDLNDPPTEPLTEMIDRLAAERPLALAPSVYFHPTDRTEILRQEWRPLPWGSAFLLESISGRKGLPFSEEDLRRGDLIWEPVDFVPGSPPSELRDGLTGSQFLGRAMLQSALAHFEVGHTGQAERGFLYALSHPDANHSVAAMGYARVLFEKKEYAEAQRTLTEELRDDEEGAWMGHRLMANLLRLEGELAEAAEEMERALQLLPGGPSRHREEMTATLNNLRGARSGDR